MSTEIKAPVFPESVADGTIATWHKKPGEAVTRDELLVDIETDKVVLEVVAPADGRLVDVVKQEGDVVESAEVIAHFEAGTATADTQAGGAVEKPQPTPEPAAPASSEEPAGAGPAARRLMQEHDLDPKAVTGSGRGGRITKQDVIAHLEAGEVESDTAAPQPAAEQAPTPAKPTPDLKAAATPPSFDQDGRPEKRVPMTRIRASIARRLVEAQQTAAMLTTFNEVNMQPLMALRRKYGEEFEKRHDGTRLGFMSFFVRASVEALKRFPEVNASIDGNDIVYHGYQDIGVAVSTDRGLVVPVLRDADQLGLAEIENKIRAYGTKARDGKLAIEDMQGGTFTISNGGVFGSLLSTPILNPPQTGILGMHAIKERPMAVDGEVKILPMMYLALSYDHRLVDGRGAVQFLVTVKELIEEPARVLLDL